MNHARLPDGEDNWQMKRLWFLGLPIFVALHLSAVPGFGEGAPAATQNAMEQTGAYRWIKRNDCVVIGQDEQFDDSELTIVKLKQGGTILALTLADYPLSGNPRPTFLVRVSQTPERWDTHYSEAGEAGIDRTGNATRLILKLREPRDFYLAAQSTQSVLTVEVKGDNWSRHKKVSLQGFSNTLSNLVRCMMGYPWPAPEAQAYDHRPQGSASFQRARPSASRRAAKGHRRRAVH